MKFKSIIFKKLKNKKNIYYFNKDYKFKPIQKKKFNYEFGNFKKVLSNPSLKENTKSKMHLLLLQTAMLLKKIITL